MVFDAPIPGIKTEEAGVTLVRLVGSGELVFEKWATVSVLEALSDEELVRAAGPEDVVAAEVDDGVAELLGLDERSSSWYTLIELTAQYLECCQ